MLTFDIFSFDGFDGDISVVDLVVAFEDITVLSRTDLPFENVVVYYFGH